MPGIEGIAETALFVEDPEAVCAFYHEVLGLPVLDRDERGCVLGVTGDQVLLVVSSGHPRRLKSEQGIVPAIDGKGPTHLALAIAPGELAGWRTRLEAAGLEVTRMDWEDAGTSLYVFDPAGNLVELVTSPARLWGTTEP